MSKNSAVPKVKKKKSDIIATEGAQGDKGELGLIVTKLR